MFGLLQRTPLRVFYNAFRGLSANVWLLALVTFINRSGTMVIPFMTVYLTVDRQFSLQQAGWVMGAFGLGSLLGAWIGGRLTDRIGFYPVQFWSLFLSGFVFVGLMFLQSLWALSVGVFILSTIADAFRPANFVAVAVYSKPENLTRSMALVRMAINLGWSVGPAIGGFLAASLGYSLLFLADGLTCILAAVVMRIFLPPRKANNNPAVEEAPDVVHTPPYQDKPFLLFLAMMTLVALCFMQFIHTLPVFCKTQLGMSEDQIGLLLALNGLAIGLSEVTLVYILEGRFHKIWLMCIGALVIGLAYISLNLHATWVGVAVICMSLLTLGEMLNFPFSNSYAMSRATGKTRGQYMAYYTMGFAVTTILAPLIGLYVADHYGFRTLWFLIGGIAFVAALGTYWVGRMGGPGGFQAAGKFVDNAVQTGSPSGTSAT
ncbi:MAG: MFS transporter [Saprospiraceae bacterium]|nr:MFS transporter [Saprospiraceae bacterium]